VSEFEPSVAAVARADRGSGGGTVWLYVSRWAKVDSKKDLLNLGATKVCWEDMLMS
jgi:hypothetical protein